MPAPKLGKWHRSRAGVGGFGYKQAVRNLDEGSLYRVRVDYRWYDEDGEVDRAGAQALRDLPEPDRAAEPARAHRGRAQDARRGHRPLLR